MSEGRWDSDADRDNAWLLLWPKGKRGLNNSEIVHVEEAAKQLNEYESRIAELERENAALRGALAKLKPCEMSRLFSSYAGWCLKHAVWGCTVSKVLAAYPLAGDATEGQEARA